MVEQVLLVHAELAEHPLQLVPQALDTLDVVLLVEGEADPAVASRVTRFSGRGRSSPHSQKSTAWWASTSNGIPGETRPAQRGALARICSASDLPSIWIPPSGNSQSSAPRYQSFRARVFWNRVGLGSLDTAISARLLCRM